MKLTPEIARRVNREVACSNRAISTRHEQALKKEAFDQLMERGYCFYKSGSTDLMVTFRAQESGGTIKVNLDVIDPRAKRVVGILDFEVIRKLFGFIGKDRAVSMGIEFLPKAVFAEEAARALFQAGFNKEDLKPLNFSALRWPKDHQVGFWVADGYRQKDGTVFSGLSGVLMNTALRIVKGLGIDAFEIENVGMPGKPESTGKLMQYFVRQFGAEVSGPGSVVIRI